MIVAAVGLSGSVTERHAHGSMLGSVEGGAAGSTLLGTVTTFVVDANEGAAPTVTGAPRGPVYSYYRIKLAGEWIPEDDLVDPLTIDESLDAPGRSIEFGLAGRSYSHLVTENTFTRAALEIHIYKGPTPNTADMLEEVIEGYVLFGPLDGRGPVTRIKAADGIGKWGADGELCFEHAPLQAYTRGAIMASIGTSVGLTVNSPDGAVFPKAVQASSVPAVAFLVEFAEPEGWYARFNGDALDFFAVELKEAPMPPDWEWTPDDWVTCQSEPPGRAPSRWVVRGNASVSIDEVGAKTVRTESEIVGLFAPDVATQWQNVTTCTLTPQSFSSAEEERVISRFVDEQTTQGGRIVRQNTDELGWYVARAAKLVSDTGVGYACRGVFLNGDGEFINGWRERFGLLTRRKTQVSYDSEWNKTRQTEEEHGYYRRTRGVGNGGDGDNLIPTVANTYIYDDENSYHWPFELFGLRRLVDISFQWDALGRLDREVADLWEYYAPKSKVDGIPGGTYWVVYDGSGQSEATASWRIVETRDKRKWLREDGSQLGTYTTIHNWGATAREGGANNWGTHSSDMDAEVFGFDEVETEAFNQETPEQVEVVKYDGEGRRRADTILGRVPLPLFATSAWTRSRLEPFEVILDDATAEAWWGFSRRVVENPYLVDESEAWSMLERLRRESLSDRFAITRRDHSADLGDTVLAMDPRQGLWDRLLIWGRRRTLSIRTASAEVVYSLKRFRV